MSTRRSLVDMANSCSWWVCVQWTMRGLILRTVLEPAIVSYSGSRRGVVELLAVCKKASCRKPVRLVSHMFGNFKKSKK